MLHLERALEQVDNALSANTDKKPKKQDAADWVKVCKYLRRLEEIACEKGERRLRSRLRLSMLSQPDSRVAGLDSKLPEEYIFRSSSLPSLIVRNVPGLSSSAFIGGGTDKPPASSKST